MSSNKSLLGYCVTLTERHLPSAIILFRLHYWHYRTTVKVKGVSWVALTVKQWADECGLTHEQTKDAFTNLRKLNLVETHKMFFGSKLVLHTRLSSRAEVKMGAFKSEYQSQMAPTDSGQMAPTGTCQTAPTYIHKIKEISLDIKNGNEAAPVAPESEKEFQNLGNTAGVKKLIRLKKKVPSNSVSTAATAQPAPEKTALTVKDVMAGLSSKKPVLKPNSIAALEFTWHSLTEGYSKPLTMKERGMLKHFLNACPPGKSEAVLTAVMQNWVEFAKMVESAAGLKVTPAKPDMGFLVKHAGHAVNLRDKLASKGPVKVQAPAKASPAPVQLIAQTKEPEADAPKSVAELLEILGGSDD